MSSRNVVVVGAGGVLGEALCREFVPDSRVVALRRPGSAPVKVEGVRTFALQFAEPNTASEALAGVFEDDAVEA